MDSRGTGRYHREPDSNRLVLIGVQARTQSTRLPNKVMLPIAGKALFEHVMDACTKSSDFLNRNSEKIKAQARVVALVPANDPLVREFDRKYTIMESESPEDDVLARYVEAMDELRPQYIVRITADCIFTMPYLISRCVKAALFKEYDYVSNVMVRTFREGMDVEVLSQRMLQWLDDNAKTKEDREHVTTKLRDRSAVPWGYRYCHVLNDLDDSYIKTSIDTQDDYNRAVAEFDSLRTKRRTAGMNGDCVS